MTPSNPVEMQFRHSSFYIVSTSYLYVARMSIFIAYCLESYPAKSRKMTVPPESSPGVLLVLGSFAGDDGTTDDWLGAYTRIMKRIRIIQVINSTQKDQENHTQVQAEGLK